MTLFYYPDTLEVMLAISKRGIILCPYLYELRRLYSLQQSKNPEDRQRFDTYVETYLRPNESVSDLAMRVAGLRHPVDIRMQTARMPSEEEWLKAVRLYGNFNTALLHVQTPPVGVILGLDVGSQPQKLLLVPESLNLENHLKEVHIRADETKRFMVISAFNRYLPKFFKIT